MIPYKYIQGSVCYGEAVEWTIREDGRERFCTIDVSLLLCGVYDFKCKDGGEIRLTPEQRKSVLTFLRRERDAIRGRDSIKTLETWRESGLRKFEDYVRPGDVVSGDLVDYFRNCLTPASDRPGYMQMGEPYDRAYDTKTKHMRATYMTFEKQGRKSWVYLGNCFMGETEDMSRGADRIDELIKRAEAEIKG